MARRKQETAPATTTTTTTTTTSEDEFAGAKLVPPADPPTPDYEADDATAERVLRSASVRGWFDQQVENAKRAGKEVLTERSASLWEWKNGPARFRAEGLKRLTWLDPHDGTEKSSVLLLATVLDGQERSAKALAGQSVLLGLPYSVARALARACHATVDRDNPPSKFFDELERKGMDKVVVDRLDNFIAYVTCGADGQPVYTNIRGCRRMMADAGCAVV